MLCRATSVMSDKGVLWSDKVQTAIKNLLIPAYYSHNQECRKALRSGGHRGLIGFSWQKSISMRKFNICGSRAPLVPWFLCLCSQLQLCWYNGLRLCTAIYTDTCTYNVNVGTVAIRFTKNLTELHELMSQ